MRIIRIWKIVQPGLLSGISVVTEMTEISEMTVQVFWHF